MSPVPLARIRVAAAAVGEPKRAGRAVLGGSVGALSVALLAAAIVHQTGAQIVLGPSGTIGLHFVATRADGWGVSENPTAAELRRAVARADFPVEFPSGLPVGTSLRNSFQLGPSAIILSYDLPGAWRRSDHVLQIILANPNAVTGSAIERTRGDHLIQFGPSGRARLRWQIAGETVIIPRSNALPEELAAIKRSMLAHARDRAH